ncbi:hypothetical protein JCM6882_009665 [Rhodosporidiobolus microsporus]
MTWLGKPKQLAKAAQADIKRRNNKAQEEGEVGGRDKDEDAFVYGLSLESLEGELQALVSASPGDAKVGFIVNGGYLYTKAIRLAAVAKARGKCTKEEAQEFVNEGMTNEAIRQAVRLRALVKDVAGERTVSVAIIGDHPTDRPRIKTETLKKRALNRYRAEARKRRRTQRAATQKQGKAAKRWQGAEEHGQAYRWTIDDLDLEIKEGKHGHEWLTIKTAPHEADCFAFKFIGDTYDAEDVVFVNGINGDLLLLAHAGEKPAAEDATSFERPVKAIINPTKTGVRLLRTAALFTGVLQHVWPFKTAAAAALSRSMSGDDYGIGIDGIGPGKFIVKDDKASNAWVDFVNRDWGFAQELDDWTHQQKKRQFESELQHVVGSYGQPGKHRDKRVQQATELTYEFCRERVQGRLGLEVATTDKRTVRDEAVKQADRAAEVECQELKKKYGDANVYWEGENSVAGYPDDEHPDDVVIADERDKAMDIDEASSSHQYDNKDVPLADPASTSAEDKAGSSHQADEGGIDAPKVDSSAAVKGHLRKNLGASQSRCSKHSSAGAGGGGYVALLREYPDAPTDNMQQVIDLAERIEVPPANANAPANPRKRSHQQAPRPKAMSIREIRAAHRAAFDKDADVEAEKKTGTTLKEAMRPSTIRMSFDQGIHRLEDCGDHLAGFLKLLVYITGRDADRNSLVFNALRRRAYEINPAHPLLGQFMEKDTIERICKYTLLRQWLKNGDQIGEMNQRDVQWTPSMHEQVEQEEGRQLSKNETPDRQESMEMRWHAIPQRLRQRLLYWQLPIFVDEVITEVLDNVDISVWAPDKFFEEVHGSAARGWATSARVTAPNVIRCLARRLSEDLVVNGQDFLNRFGDSDGTAQHTPSQATSSFLVELQGPSPGATNTRSALGAVLETLLLLLPVHANSVETPQGWEHDVSQAIHGVLVHCRTELIRAGMLKNDIDDAAKTLAKIVVQVGAVVRSSYAGTKLDETLESWLSGANIWSLVSAQAGWRVWLGIKDFVMHGKTFVLTSHNIYTVFNQAEELVKWAIKDMNGLVGKLNTAVSVAKYDNLSKQRVPKNGQLGKDLGIYSLGGVAQLDPEDGRPFRCVEVKSSLIDAVKGLKQKIDDVLGKGDLSKKWPNSTVAIWNILLSLPNKGRLFPGGYTSISFGQIAHVMRDPARIRKGVPSARNDIKFIEAAINNPKSTFSASNLMREPECRAFATTGSAGRRIFRRVKYEQQGPTQVETLIQIEPPFILDPADPNKLKWDVGGREPRQLIRVRWSSQADYQIESPNNVDGSNSIKRTIRNEDPPAPPTTPSKKKGKGKAIVLPPVESELPPLTKDDFPPNTLIVGNDPGEFNSFALSLSSVCGGYKPEAILFRSAQMVSNDKDAQHSLRTNSDSMLIKHLAEWFKNESAHTDNSLAFEVVRLWERDPGRLRLIVTHQLRHEARLKSMARGVARHIAETAAHRRNERIKIEGGKKEKPLVIIAHGGGLSAQRSSSASGADRRSSPTDMLYKALSAHHDIRLLIIRTNEDLSSQTCPNVGCRCLTAKNKEQLEVIYGTYVNSDTPCYRLLRCKHCKVVFERDFLGATNIAEICLFKLLTSQHLFSPEVEDAQGFKPRQKRIEAEEKARKVIEGSGHKKAKAGPILSSVASTSTSSAQQPTSSSLSAAAATFAPAGSSQHVRYEALLSTRSATVVVLKRLSAEAAEFVPK